ncbi:hypothetical protein D1Y84_01750 [Acidipila sp. EB88]|nr:hypothetical protein D1Y84_01750 [Acidipila sp. EB88]
MDFLRNATPHRDTRQQTFSPAGTLDASPVPCPGCHQMVAAEQLETACDCCCEARCVQQAVACQGCGCAHHPAQADAFPDLTIGSEWLRPGTAATAHRSTHLEPSAASAWTRFAAALLHATSPHHGRR